jgi:hypothetical protein
MLSNVQFTHSLCRKRKPCPILCSLSTCSSLPMAASPVVRRGYRKGFSFVMYEMERSRYCLKDLKTIRLRGQVHLSGVERNNVPLGVGHGRDGDVNIGDDVLALDGSCKKVSTSVVCNINQRRTHHYAQAPRGKQLPQRQRQGQQRRTSFWQFKGLVLRLR